MAQNLQPRIQAIHEWYCRNVMPLRLTPEVERIWFEWFRAGYSGPDLRDVIRYIRQQISFGKRNEGALKLTNLIQRSEAGFIGFDQDLGLARSRRNLSVDKRLEPVPDSVSSEVGEVSEVSEGARKETAPVVPRATAHVSSALEKLKASIQ